MATFAEIQKHIAAKKAEASNSITENKISDSKVSSFPSFIPNTVIIQKTREDKHIKIMTFQDGDQIMYFLDCQSKVNPSELKDSFGLCLFSLINQEIIDTTLKLPKRAKVLQDNVLTPLASVLIAIFGALPINETIAAKSIYKIDSTIYQLLHCGKPSAMAIKPLINAINFKEEDDPMSLGEVIIASIDMLNNDSKKLLSLLNMILDGSITKEGYAKLIG